MDKNLVVLLQEHLLQQEHVQEHLLQQNTLSSKTGHKKHSFEDFFFFFLNKEKKGLRYEFINPMSHDHN